ncbi:OppA family ABC transporter substrate-binding lipoprotein [Mycoplasma sp. 1573]
MKKSFKSKFKAKRYFLALGVMALPISSVAFIAASCDDKQQEVSKEVVFNLKDNLRQGAYFLDYSAKLSINYQDNPVLETAVSGQLFRNITISSPEYDTTTKALKKSGQVAYKFELAKSITITLEDGSQKVYDKDDYELSTSDTNPYEYQKSSDSRSINSEQFIQDMRAANKISIQVRDDVYWTDADGNKTQYKVVAEDFWYSYLRSYFQGRFQRQEAGYNGTPDQAKAVDKNIQSVTGVSPIERFGKQLFTHNQLMEINGISSEKFRAYDKTTYAPVNAVKDNSLVLEIDEDFKQQKDIFNYWNLMFINSNIFAAAPSQYIKELAQKPEYNTMSTVTMENPKTKEKYDVTVKTYGYDIVHASGIYFYGVKDWENNLYAGAYIPSKDSTTSKFILKQNPNYWDQDWAKSKNSVKQIVFNSLSTDNSRNYSNFKNGQNAFMTYDVQDQSTKDALNKNSSNYSVVPFKHFLKTKTTIKSVFNFTPAPRVAYDDDTKVAEVNYESIAFNNNYAKLVYGASIDEIQKGYVGTDLNHVTRSITKGALSPLSASFKTMINKAINWQQIVSKLNPDANVDLWLNGAAPDAKIGGTDQETSQYKTPRDAKDIINDLIAIDAQGNKLTLTANNAYKNDTKSIYFDSIKPAMKKLLDDFYKENSLSSDQKITWYIYNSSVVNTAEEKAYNDMIQVIKDLDSRLDPVFKKLNTNEDIVKIFGADNGTGANTISQHLVLNYEDDSQASYLDKITHAIGQSMFPLFQLFADADKGNKSPLAQNFPELTNFAKFMKKQFDNGNFKMNEIYKPNAADKNLEAQFKPLTWNDLDKMNSYEERNLYLRGIWIDDLKAYSYRGLGGPAYKYDASKGIFSIDNITEAAKLARDYLKTVTNEQVVQLLRELNTWRGVEINLEKWIPSLNNLDYRYSQKYLSAPIAFNDIDYVQDMKINTTKEK